MKELDIFLEALGKITGENYIPHLTVTPSKFKAIKEFKIDVWIIRKGSKELISSVSIIQNATTNESKEKAICNVSVITIENILKYYGIQQISVNS